LATALIAGEAAPTAPTRPIPADVLSPSVHRGPQVLWNGKLQFREHREHQIVIASQSRQIVDEHYVEEARLRGSQ
jgi:hypothetical protein